MHYRLSADVRHLPPRSACKPLCLAVAIATLGAVGVSRPVSANGWTGIALNDNWSNAFNWHEITPPISDVVRSGAAFGSSVGARTNVDLNANWAVAGMVFEPDKFGIEQSFHLFSTNGSALTLGDGGIDNTTSHDQTIDFDLILDIDTAFRAGRGDILLKGARSGSGNFGVFSGLPSEAGNRNHVVFLGGDGSRHTGNVTIRSGILRLGNVDAISDQSTVIISAAGTLDLFNTTEVVGGLSTFRNGSDEFNGDGAIALGIGSLTFGVNNLDTTLRSHLSGGAAAAFIKDGHGTTLLEKGDNSAYLGRFEVRKGTLALGEDDAVGAASPLIVHAGATAQITVDSEEIGSLAGAGQVILDGQDIVAGGNGSSTVFTGAITGTGNFFKAGRGVMTLRGGDKEVNNLPYESGVNTFAGAVTVLNGTLELGLGNTLANHQAVTVNADGTLRLVDDDEAIGALAGAGRVDLNFHNLSVGTDDGDSTFSGIIDKTGNFSKTGGGTLRLTGINKFVGSVTVAAGTLELGVGDTLTNRHQVTVANGARLRISGDDENFGTLAGDGEVELEKSLALGFDDGSSSFGGTLRGDGGLTKAGRGLLSLGGANHYGGRTKVAAGALLLLGDATLEDTGASIGERRELAAQVLLQDRAQWQVNGDALIGISGPALLRIEDQARMTASGRTVIGPNGALSLGGGTLVASTIALQGGVFDFTGGSLHVGTFEGDLVNVAGTLGPGNSPGITTILGDYTQFADATLDIELAGLSLFDILHVRGGDVHLGGKLVVRLLDEFAPVVGSVFQFLETDGDILGDFDELVLPSLVGRHLVLDASNPHALSLRVIANASDTPAPVPLPPGSVLAGSALLLLITRASRKRGAGHGFPRMR